MKRAFSLIAAALTLCISLQAQSSTLSPAASAATTPSSAQDSLAFISADWNWTDLGKGAVAGSAQIAMFGRTETISVVKYPSRRYRTFIIDAPAEKAAQTDVLAKREGAVMAANGSFFDVQTILSDTFLVLDHEIIATNPSDEKYRSNALMGFRRKHSRRAEFIQYDTLKNDYYAKRYHSCIVSGPLLVKDGVEEKIDMTRRFNSTNHPRTVIGADDKGNFYYFVVDGRFPGQAEGASLTELQAICRYLGITDAINFDGGGSSTLWTEKTGILNHPYDNKRYDHEGMRVVPNIIMAK